MRIEHQKYGIPMEMELQESLQNVLEIFFLVLFMTEFNEIN